MVQVLKYIRKFFFNTNTDFEYEHWDKFNEAVDESGVEAYIYPEGQRIIERGCHVHDVTINNLISFRKLNRSNRREARKILNRKGQTQNHNAT